MSARAITVEEMKDGVETFFNSNKHYDWNLYMKLSGKRCYRDIDRVLEFVKENYDEDFYFQFLHKIDPFVYTDLNSEKRIDNVVLKDKTIDMVNRILKGEATMFDVSDEFHVCFERFYHMTRVLTFKYSVISKSAFKELNDYFDNIRGYDEHTSRITLNFPSLTSLDIEKILKSIEQRGLPFNNKSFLIAAKTYINNKKNKTNSR